MDYDAFRQVWDDALRGAGLKSAALFPQETVDLKSMDRSYSIFIHYHFPDNHPHLFYIAAELSWHWHALLSARFATTEEDLLTELFGRSRRPKRTERPYLRLDVTLHASVPADGFYPAPDNSAWRNWAGAVAASVASIFPSVAEDDPNNPTILSWCGEPEARLICSPGGQLYLRGVSLAAWQAIRLPRQWDDPRRRRDPAPDRQLVEFFQRVREGLDAWEDALGELAIG